MKIFNLFFLIVFGNYCYSQNISINYNSTGAGINSTLTFSKQFDKNEVGIGIGININSLTQPDDQNNLFYKRLFANKPIHYLNLNLYYQRFIFTNLKYIKPFVFYDFQYKYSTTRSSMYNGYKIDTSINGTIDEQIVYIKQVATFGPFHWLENYIGVGFKVKISDKWFLQQKIGVGGFFLIDGKQNNKWVVANKTGITWEFGRFFNFSLGHEF